MNIHMPVRSFWRISTWCTRFNDRAKKAETLPTTTRRQRLLAAQDLKREGQRAVRLALLKRTKKEGQSSATTSCWKHWATGK